MRDIVLVTVDSLRADHVGWHGYNRETTPYLSGQTESAQTFTSAFAHACSTRPSFPSILTSSYALMYGGYERLSSNRTTLAEVLSAAGYDTAGFHSNPYLSAEFGYDRGFEAFFDSKSDSNLMTKLRQLLKTRMNNSGRLYGFLQQVFNMTERQAGIEFGSAYVDATDITDRALSWARSTTKSPRFLWVHYMDVHHPYVPPAEYQHRFRDEPVTDRDAIQFRRKMLETPNKISEAELDTIVDLYDAETAYVDAEIERLIETLRGEWGEDLIFAFTADHGEELLDHGGFSHAATFYDEVLHVPLFIHDGSTDQHNQLIGLIDLAPTLADYAGIDSPESFYGTSLRQVGTEEWNRSEVVAEWADIDTGDQRFGLRTADWKYIREENEAEQLYNLNSDAAETDNRINDEPEVADDMREKIARHKRRLTDATQELDDVEIDETARQRLRDLGYHE